MAESLLDDPAHLNNLAKECLNEYVITFGNYVGYIKLFFKFQKPGDGSLY